MSHFNEYRRTIQAFETSNKDIVFATEIRANGKAIVIPTDDVPALHDLCAELMKAKKMKSFADQETERVAAEKLAADVAQCLKEKSEGEKAAVRAVASQDDSQRALKLYQREDMVELQHQKIIEPIDKEDPTLKAGVLWRKTPACFMFTEIGLKVSDALKTEDLKPNIVMDD